MEDRSVVCPQIVVYPFRTPTLPPATSTNTTIFEGKELIVVDPATPYADERERFDRILKHYQSLRHRVGALILTHHHVDHVGDAARLAQMLSVPMWAHEETAVRLDFSVDKLLVDGEQIELSTASPMNLQVIHTPGHAPGHICLFESSTKTLVAGDMIASIGTILIEPFEGHLGTYLSGLRRLLELEPQWVIPAHGLPLPTGAVQIKATHDHRLMRIEEVFSLISSNRSKTWTVNELVQKIYQGRIPDAILPIAMLSLESTLHFLVEQGRIRREESNQYYLGSSH